ncbi:MAG: C25 family cysteine peptidase [Pirellulales bacterium]
MATALLCLLIAAQAGQAYDTVVVCPAEFRQALAPWVAHREAQGHRLLTIASRATSAELREDVRQLARQHPLRFLVLVGDADPLVLEDPSLQALGVPAHFVPAKVNVRFGSEPYIATDNWYADLDDDRVPELAVGRLSADTPAELSGMVAKILAYEKCADYGSWRRQVHFVAGLGGFGPVADAVLEATAKTLITSGIPPAYNTSMTYGSWQSPYCPDPRRFDAVTIDRLNEGSLFWVYLGHGQQRSVDRVRVPTGTYPILDCPDAARLECRHGAPIACFLACYSGAFDQPRDCLAEEMLRNPRGPVAILCGTRVTMPYGMAVLGSELLDECFGRQPETLGELFVAVKRHTVHPQTVSRHRAALDTVGRAFAWAIGSDAEAERYEHLDLFNLLGDPLLRLPFPQPVKLAVPATALPGGALEITGHSPIAGRCTVELVVRRDRLTFHPPERGQFDAQRLAEYEAVYRQANEQRLATLDVGPVNGSFRAPLAVPLTAHGPCHVRVFIEGAGGCAAGAADVVFDSRTAERPAAPR